MKGMINKALDDIRKIKKCSSHQWIGPVKEVEINIDGGTTLYEVRCKSCPLGKHYGTKTDANNAIASEAPN